MIAPVFLPDGQHLIISSRTDAERAVYLAPVGGGDPRKLVALPKQSPVPYLALSPDGKHLLFTESTKTITTFSVVDLAATLPSLKSVKPTP
jgi:Tol biopolymer transport system component